MTARRFSAGRTLLAPARSFANRPDHPVAEKPQVGAAVRSRVGEEGAEIAPIQYNYNI
jgi:hypothetical protein